MLLLGAVVCAFADIVSSENSFIGFHFPEDALGSNLTFGTVSFKQLDGQGGILWNKNFMADHILLQVKYFE